MSERLTPSRRGWLLVGLIVLISAVIVGLVGATLFLTSHLRLVSLRRNHTKAIYLAQAGIMQAIYDLKRMTAGAGGVTLSQEYVVDAGPSPGTSDDDVFVLGGQADDFLLVNMKGPMTFTQANICGFPRRDRFQGWSMTNILASNTAPLGFPMIISAVRVDWANGVPTDRVLRIELNGVTVFTNCPGLPLGQFINVTDIAINPRQTWPAGNNTRIWFNTRDVASGKASIDLTFRMTPDNSERSAHYEPTVANRSADVTLKSIGTVRKGAFPFSVWRRLEADYRLSGTALTSTGNLLSYRELSTQTP